MKIDQPSIAQLGAASERAVPDSQDGILNILPVVFPSVPLIQPIQPGPGSTTIVTTSFASRTSISRVNQAGITTFVQSFSRGLWTINWTLSLWTNYLHTGVAQDCALSLVQGVNSRVIAELYANNDSQSLSGSFRLLVREDTSIQITAGTNGVGQELLTSGSVIAEKHI